MQSKFSKHPYEVTTINYNKLQSQTIDWIRFPLIVGVVFIHNSMLGDIDSIPTLSLEGLNLNIIVTYFKVMITQVLVHILVPCFFLISGFLFFRNSTNLTMASYKEKMQRRFYRLVVPYILWNLIFLLLYLLMFAKHGLEAKSLQLFFEQTRSFFESHGWLDVMWSCTLLEAERTNLLGQTILSTGPILPSFWFLRELIVVSVLAPVIYWLVKHLRYIFILFLLLCYFTGVWIQIPAASEMAVLYFSVGVAFSIHQKNIIVEFRRIEKISYMLSVILLLLATYYKGNRGYWAEPGPLFYHCYVIIGSVALFNIASRLLESGKTMVNRTLTGSVMFIYAFHSIWFINLIDVFINWTLAEVESWWYELIVFIITPFVKVGICIGVYLLLEKYFPKLLDILTGRIQQKKSFRG